MTFVVAAAVQVAFLALVLLGLAAWLHSRGVRPPVALGGAMVLYGCLSLVAFWLAWLLLPSQALANGLRALAMLAGVVVAGFALIQRRVHGQIALPILIMVAASLALLLWVHAGTDMSQPLSVAGKKWTSPLPGDNQIPFDFAEGFRRGRIPTPLHADWLSSDRPPLQTAMYMLTPGFLLWPGDPFAYQAAGVAFQMFALVGVWVLAQSVVCGTLTSLLAVAAVASMPMTLVNGAFVWPKLLPAAFLCLVVAFYFGREHLQDRSSAVMGTLVGAAAGLAMLGHGSTAFVLIGMALSAAILWRWAAPRFIAAGAVAFVVLYAPWAAYQKFVDPPGDRLVKWHLAGAGIQAIDPRPTGTVVKSAYSALTLADITERRTANLRALAEPRVAEPQVTGLRHSYARTYEAFKLALGGQREKAAHILKDIRMGQFFTVALGSGLLGLSLFFLPILLAAQATRALALVVSASMFTWIMLLFEAGQATIHQGSYFVELGLVTGAVIGLSALSPLLAAGAVSLHAALTLFQYAL